MKTVITSIETGFSNNYSRRPYAWARTACGHGTSVEIVPSQYACGGCGSVSLHCDRNKVGCCDYTGGFTLHRTPNPHKECDRITKLGEPVECARCDRYAEQLASLKALDWSTVSHTRFRGNVSTGNGYISIYCRDHTSPTGVLQAMGIEATPEVERYLSASGASPLSPTEGL